MSTQTSTFLISVCVTTASVGSSIYKSYIYMLSWKMWLGWKNYYSFMNGNGDQFHKDVGMVYVHFLLLCADFVW